MSSNTRVRTHSNQESGPNGIRLLVGQDLTFAIRGAALRD